ncbi:MAG: 3'(2'),5'-bisphosphate nucleotidase CysQ [bacterium]
MRLPELMDDVEALANEAADAACEIYEENFDVEFKKDDQDSPLTEADLEANRIITAGLQELTPEIPIISEESEDNLDYDVRKDFDRFWLVDPLDGTREFVNKNDEFTVNIGLIEHGVPIAGVVVAPVPDVTYRTDGINTIVRRNGQTSDLRVSDVSDLSKSTLMCSRSHRRPPLQELIEGNEFGNVTPKGSSLKLCNVAEGKSDVYCRFGPTWEWDTAAADAILRMSGGKITEPDGNNLVYNTESLKNDRGFVVTNSLLHDEIVEEMSAIIGEPEGIEKNAQTS